jgi:uncharacterized membrane protein
MKTSELSSKPPSRLLKLAPWLLAGVAILGLADASYLTANHYLGVTAKCVIIQGCDKVTNSPYATMFGVPVALLGALYYLSVLIGSVWCLDTGSRKFLRWLSVYTTVGFIASIYFVYLQLFVIHYICIYCLFSALTSTVLFVIGLLTQWQLKIEDRKNSVEV